VSTALQPAAVSSPVVTADEVTLIKNTVAVGATDAELKLFLFDCARQGVHPLDRLIHFTKRNGKYTPITSIDFMRIRAADSGEMAGSDDAVFADDGCDSGVRMVTSATVTVYRMTHGQRFAYTATARWDEYYPGEGPVGFMWRKMPHTMLGKCAEALALRKGFPRQLAGLYAKEEMEQAESSPTPPQAVSYSTPAREREKPVAATVENRGTLQQSVDASEPASTQGYALIDDFRVDGDWSHIDWNRDAQGGTMTYKTKLAKIANKCRVAFNDRVPVRLISKKYPYVDDVQRLDDSMSPEAIKKTKWTPAPDGDNNEMGF
jgi:phage recombination protein Bet